MTRKMILALFSLACIRPGHLCIHLMVSDPTEGFAYATPVPEENLVLILLCMLGGTVALHVMPKSMAMIKSGRTSSMTNLVASTRPNSDPKLK